MDEVIKSHTELLPVLGLEDLSLYQATMLTPLWELTEAGLERQQLAPPFWAFVWSGGLGLSYYLRAHPELVRDKVVLDLATGSGLVAIVCAKLGAQRVMANDIDPYAKAATLLNACENGVEIEFLLGNVLDELPACDLILAGDVCYERAMRDAFFASFQKAHARGTKIIIGDPHRSYLPEHGLTKLSTLTVPACVEIEEASQKQVSIYAFGEG